MAVCKACTRIIFTLALLPGAPLAMAAPAPTPVAAVAAPDGLDATLQRLAGSAPIAGTLSIDKTSVTGSGAKTKRSSARFTLDVAAARGISLRAPGSLVAQAEQQYAAHQRDPEASMAAAELLGDTNLVQVQRMLDPAAALRAQLIGARLLGQSSTTLDGVPATLLRFDLPLVATASERKMVQHYQATLSLWLDAQGVPLGYTLSSTTQIGWFVLHLDNTRNEQGRFAVVAGRLVTTRLDVQQDGSALGHHGSSTTDYSLHLSAHAPIPAAHAAAATGA
jgi:hypothetical protein